MKMTNEEWQDAVLREFSQPNRRLLYCCMLTAVREAALSKTSLDYTYVHNLFQKMSLNKRLKCVHITEATTEKQNEAEK